VELMRGAARIRYRAAEVPATARVLEDGGLVVEFDEPQRAVSPGQTVVLYQGDTVVAGGTIVRAVSDKRSWQKGSGSRASDASEHSVAAWRSERERG
jgi:hypothetical protein